jgi:hypothetical protein
MPERVYSTPLLDKLGVRPGARVAIVGHLDRAVVAQIAERTTDIVRDQPRDDRDLILLAADSIEELGALGTLRTHLRQAGAIWVVSRKGRAATIRDVDVIGAARDAGLVDNKVASFSDTHTALRLVIPRRLRVADG